MVRPNEQDDDQGDQHGSVPAEVRRHLERMREDYAAKEGKPFGHFYCPLLLRDEPADLCMGHVVPQAFDGCCRARVAQRADLDNWYGAAFESDLVTTLQVGGASVRDVVFDEALRKKIQTRILVDEEECGVYAFKGHKPACHTGITLEHGSVGAVLPLVLKRSIDEVLADQHRSWKLVVEHDGRVAALVSLIKAAYLSLFRTFGYRYALSVAVSG